MKPILRSTAILSSSSVVAIALGLVSAKALALLIGPKGLGDLALLQSLLGLATLIAGAGIGTGLVRDTAIALARNDEVRVAALRRSAWYLTVALATLAMIVLTLLRDQLSHVMLGNSHLAQDVVLVGLAAAMGLVGGLQGSLLNAYHRVAAMAKASVSTSVTATASTIAVIWFFRDRGIALALLSSAIIGFLVSSYFVRKTVPGPALQPSRQAVRKAGASLVYFGAPYTISQIVGTGVQLLLPVLILHKLGTEGVGFYRASAAISVGYLGFLLTAMAQDYYPRLSASRDKPQDLVALINQQQRLVMLLGIPMIYGTLALAPYLVPLIYSRAFAPTVTLLEWQLIGDLFKFSSWTMSYAILARCSGTTYFLMEFIAGVTILSSNWIAMIWFGLPGLGIAFLFSYIVYCLVVWILIRREITFTWASGNITLLACAVVGACIIRILPFIGLGEIRTIVALALSILFGVRSLQLLHKDWRSSLLVPAT